MKLLLPIASLIVIVALAYFAYRYYRTNAKLGETRGELSSLTEKTSQLEQELVEAKTANEQLAVTLEDEQKRNSAFEKQIKGISNTVGTLEKLSKTDPELLQKYSKVYFLNEHYIPTQISDIPKDYIFGTLQQIHAQVLPELTGLIDDAAEDDIELRVVSGYRSFGTQAALKQGYRVTYGSGANQFSADQGYSEHQLGTTVDFTTPTLGNNFTSFESADAYAWLLDNAYKYGFILSYPKGNAYYQFEPWHWRFVGENLARTLHRRDQHFYDMDQRQIDAFLVELFD